MELDDLKSAWSKISSVNEKKQQLPEEEFRRILKKRTLDITDKIGRNIRIGIGIILAWVCIGFTVDYILSPVLEDILNKPYLTQELMFWAFILETLNYVLIISAIIVFWIRYNKIEKTKIDTSNLKSKVGQLMQILNSYKRMFYIVLASIILYVIIAFCTGFFMEYKYQINEAGINLNDLNFIKWIVIIFAFFISLGILIAIYFLLFNYFFKRLYGRYLKQLENTMKEIKEATSF